MKILDTVATACAVVYVAARLTITFWRTGR